MIDCKFIYISSGKYQCQQCGYITSDKIYYKKPPRKTCTRNIQQTQLSQDIISKGKRLWDERSIWKKAGGPLRTDEEIFRIYNEVCKPCQYFVQESENVGKCGICGCFLKGSGKFFNKIAWATTNCPHNPPKWVAEVKVETPTDIKTEEPKLEPEMFQVQTDKQQNGLKMKEVQSIVPPAKPKGGCGCGR